MSLKNQNILTKLSRIAYYSLIAVFVSVNFVFLLPTQSAEAAEKNVLKELGEKCKDMNKTGDGAQGALGSATGAAVGAVGGPSAGSAAGELVGGVGGGTWADCEKLQKTLEDNLGCSGTMFYEATDDLDATAKTGKWYTKGGDYAACYAKAKAKLDNVVKKCKNMKRSGGDSQLWKDCEKEQDRLGEAVGCSKNFFRESNKKGYWETNPSSIKSCEGNINAAGSVKVAGKRGTDGKTAAEFASASGFKGAAGEGASGTSTDDSPSCKTFSTSPLGWIVCPLIDMGAGFTDWAFSSFIKPLLTDVPVSTDPDSPTFKTWQGFRVLGNVILVGAMLAIVYAQVRGGR